MLPSDGPQTDPVMMVAPDGTIVHVPRFEYERYRQEPDQPSPTRSDGEVRNAVNPDTGQDMGGNPLQEGIWATVDGGWKPSTKRDESYASVRVAGTVVQPHEAGIHNRPMGLLSRLPGVTIDGIAATPENHNYIVSEYGFPGRGKHGLPVQVNAHHPAFEQLAAKIIQDGHGNGEVYKPDLMAIKQGIQAGEIPPPPKVAAVQLVPEPMTFEADLQDGRLEVGPSSPFPSRRRLDLSLNRALKKNDMHGHQLGWTPGMRGRGIMIGDNFHTWNAYDPNSIDESQVGVGSLGPMHSEYVRTLPVNPQHVDYRSGVEIHPDGGVESVTGYDTSRMVEADPRLHPKTTDDLFNFGHVMDETVKTAFAEPILDTHIEMPWYMEDPVLDKKASVEKESFLPALGLAAGGLLRAAAPTLLRSALGHGAFSAGGALLNGGGAQGPQQENQEGVPDDSYYSAVETLHSNPGFHETEDGDTKQFDDESTSTNQDNPNKDNDGGGSQSIHGEDKDDAPSQDNIFSEDSEAIKHLETLLPLVLHYVKSEEAGENDPALVSLHQALDAEAPGYLDKGDDEAAKKFLESIEDTSKEDEHKSAAAPVLPLQQQTLQQPPQQARPDQNVPLNPTIPPQAQQHQLTQMQQAAEQPGIQQTGPNGGSANFPPTPDQQGNQLTPEEQEQLRQLLLRQGRTAADHQGPVTKEQQAAVAELLTENGRVGEIPNMIQAPWDYSEELAQVAQRLNTPPNVDPTEETQAPPMPAQEVAPPGDTMPVPNPADPTQQNAAPQMMASIKKAQLPMEPESFLNPYEHPRIPCPCGGRSGAACPACHGSGMLDFSHLRGADFADAFGENGKGWGHDGMEGIKDMGGPRDVATFAEGTGLHWFPPIEDDGYRHQGRATTDSSEPQMRGASTGRNWNQIFAADNVAPRCPKCGSGTTGVDDTGGESFHCHACDNTWSEDKLQPVETKVALRDDVNPINIPAADQASPMHSDQNQDTSFSWQDNSNQPLQAGQTYEMRSEQYSIPDVVKVMAVKPDTLVVQTVGEYENETGATMPYTHEISREEAQMDGLEFTPKTDGDPAAQTDPGPATAVNTEPQQVPLTDERPSVSASWLMDDNDNFANAVTANLEKTAGKKYTPMEQREFIDERGVARNSDKLDLAGTHYERQSRSLDDDFGLFWTN